MTWRMGLALVALCGLLIASYIALHDLGYIGTIACGTGGCETVQTSRWATFLGIKVAVWGVAYYLLVFALAMASTTASFADARWLPPAMVGLTGWGVAFSAWLTYLELFRIHAICRWCVGSAGVVTLLFVLALLDWRMARRLNSPGARTGP
ncbi:MAG TPA: vitamin K epoxide reductase family protein [Gemmatimonadaceae bacterium]|nr:vitamin K epoxide reductase family protein [Gemmatimonadaceae bacterium]